MPYTYFVQNTTILTGTSLDGVDMTLIQEWKLQTHHIIWGRGLNCQEILSDSSACSLVNITLTFIIILQQLCLPSEVAWRHFEALATICHTPFESYCTTRIDDIPSLVIGAHSIFFCDFKNNQTVDQNASDESMP